MHILIISHNYPTPFDSSFGFFCRDQAEALVSEGHQVGVVGPLVVSIKSIVRSFKIYFGFKRLTKNGVFTYLWVGFSLPGLKTLRYFIINQIGKRMVDRYVQEKGIPDVIHLHVFVAAEVAIYASVRYGIPLVWTEHFSDVANNKLSVRERKLLEKLGASSKVTIAVSQSLADRLLTNFGVSSRVISNVYNSNIFKILQEVKKHEVFTFFSVAYMQPLKNHNRLIEAFALISELPINLIIGGIGQTYVPMKEKVCSMRLTNRIQFLGELTPLNVALEMNKSHAYVVSSDFETFNVSIVEAMACGLPVVSTKCGGPESIIANQKLGMLTNQNNEELASGMRHLFEHWNEYSPDHLAGHAMSNYSIGGIAKKLTETYLECV